jgi:molybdopterin converting factor small subunit
MYEKARPSPGKCDFLPMNSAPPVESCPQSKPLQVLLLGPVRLVLQTETCSIACPPDGSQQAFWCSLIERFPSLDSIRSSIRLARDSEFLQPEDRLRPGDEVILIAPVSGG